MSTTVTYKGATLTTVSNQTRVLETAGTYLEDDLTLVDVSGGGSPTLQNKTVHPSSSDQSITADVGYDGLGTVTAKAVTTTNLTAANIVSGVTVEVGDADDSDRILSVTGTASGGGVVEAEWNDVCLWDYDGTCLYSYTAAEFANLSALPANPTHTGLTAQGWNWSLSDAKTFVAANGFLDIGQLYVTSDAKTHIKVVVGDTKYVSIKLTGSATGNITLDWGDGSATETNTNTSAKDYTHTYAASGSYDITIARSTGTVKISQFTAYDFTIFRRVNIGSNVILDGSFMQKCFSLDKMSIPSDCDVSNLALYLTSIKCLVLPSACMYNEKAANQILTNIICFAKQDRIYAAYAQFAGDSALKRVSASVGRSGNNWPVQTFNSCKSIKRFIITDGVTGFSNANCLTDLNSLEKITIPDSITAIPASSFTNVYSLQEVHMKRTTPPTLGNTSCFTNRPATFQIYVPYSADHSVLTAYQTASNWSSYSSSMVEEPA